MLFRFFFQRHFTAGDAVVTGSPGTEIDKAAPFRAEGTEWAGVPVNLFFTGRTFQAE